MLNLIIVYKYELFNSKSSNFMKKCSKTCSEFKKWLVIKTNHLLINECYRYARYLPHIP